MLSFLFHSSARGSWYFLYLATVTSAAMDMVEPVSVQNGDLTAFGCMLKEQGFIVGGSPLGTHLHCRQ
jgi:hypothetical protein